MARQQWDEMPPATRAAIAEKAGKVSTARSVTAGSVADFASLLETDQGSFFCKGALTGTSGEGQLKNEIRLNAALSPDLVPRLRWHVKADGWLLAGFDKAPGRHADLSPGSPDLPLIAATLARMAADLTPCPVTTVQPATVRWGRLLDPDLVDGDTLAHADMTHRNFLIDDDRVSVVDWSMPCRGAAWLDTARMIVRLIRAGHTPGQAELWAQSVPQWINAPRQAVDAFAAAVAAMSRRMARDSTKPHLIELATASSAWEQHRSL